MFKSSFEIKLIIKFRDQFLSTKFPKTNKKWKYTLNLLKKIMKMKKKKQSTFASCHMWNEISTMEKLLFPFLSLLSIFEVNLWDQFLRLIFSINFWDQYLRSIFDILFWDLSYICDPMFKSSFVIKFLDQFLSSNFPKTNKNSWKYTLNLLKKIMKMKKKKQITFAACHVWNKISFYGETVISLFITTLNFWGQFVGSIFEINFWDQYLGSIFDIVFWDLRHVIQSSYQVLWSIFELNFSQNK